MSRRLIVTALVLALGAIPAARQTPAASAPAAGGGAARFTFTLTGDSIITRRLSIYRDGPFLKMIGLIRGADVAFTNLEMLFHDYESWPMNESGGTWMRADPALLTDLVWAGFDMVSRANNHAGDYGVGGMRTTTRHVAEAGLLQAGVGESLAEAREARFLDTPNGRVALVSIASTFPDHARASDTRGDMPARPGLNPLRFSTTFVVSRERLEQLRATARELGMSVPAEGESLSLWGRRFAAGSPAGVRTAPSPADLDAMRRVVASAAKMADFTVVSIHAHEGGRTRYLPADFLVTFAHAMIDAGADLFVGHGPHVTRGIEIYKGRPILYSLGDFVFENETIERFPDDAYAAIGLGRDAQIGDFNETRSDHDRKGFNTDREIWESMLATVDWDGKRLAGVTIYPLTLGFGQPMTERGRPTIATGELARHILRNIADRSQPFGARIEIDEAAGAARVVLAEAGAASAVK